MEFPGGNEVKVHLQKLPTLILATSIFVFSTLPAYSQSAGLPPVNWSKNVHNPGDNQYVPSGEQQNMRHAIPNIPVNPKLLTPVQVAGGGGGGGGGDAPSWHPTPKAPRPDISLQPIPADEPVAPP